jgi:hypothetical protein
MRESGKTVDPLPLAGEKKLSGGWKWIKVNGYAV